MTVRDILVQFLQDNGYDGLCGEDCACHLDVGTILECSSCGSPEACKPGRKRNVKLSEPCPNCGLGGPDSDETCACLFPD